MTVKGENTYIRAMTGTHMTRTHPSASLFLSLMALTLGAALLPACQKANNTSYSLTATFGPTNFQATTYSNSYSESSGTFTINADMTTTADSSSLLLTFPSPSKLNVPFNSDTALTTTVIYSTNDGANNYIAGLDGTSGHCIMTITAWDSTQHTIAGTFSGETINNNHSADSLGMTNGKFNLTYTTTN